MSRIKVVNPNESWMGTEYYIDGKKRDWLSSRITSMDRQE